MSCGCKTIIHTVQTNPDMVLAKCTNCTGKLQTVSGRLVPVQLMEIAVELRDVALWQSQGYELETRPV